MLKGYVKELRKKIFFFHREKKRRATVRSLSRNVNWGGANNDAAYTIARIIGNDLYPRHAEGQSLRNLEYILENEPDFPDCRKVFVLNRIFDQSIVKEARRMILSAGQEVIEFPFCEKEYAQTLADLSVFGGATYFESDQFSGLSSFKKYRMLMWAFAPKIRYAMNINGARNAALEDGRSKSSWTILLDGSCFIMGRAFEQLRVDMTKPPIAPYLILPMIRLQTNDCTRNDHLPASDLSEEPQVAFHCSSVEKFDEIFPYGIRDKTSLFSTLGVPGVWSFYESPEWLPAEKQVSPDRNFFKYANTSVYRLSSGHGGALEKIGASTKRYTSRNKAIFSTLSLLDDRCDSEDRAVVAPILGRCI